MGILGVWHPDIEEFITAKLSEGRLSKFNISVDCPNRFMDQVIKVKNLISQGANKDVIEEQDKWDLIFPDTTFKAYKAEWDGDIYHWQSKGYPVIVYKTISCLHLWNTIMNSTYTRNDPGVLFLDIANKTHCWNYGGRQAFIRATNPCGEQCLPFGAVCDLGSINLAVFVDIINRKFKLDKIKKYVKLLVRMLDNVNDYTDAPLPEYVESVRKRRRIGIGVMGWGSALYLLRVRYGSEEAEVIKDELMKVITHSAVEASIDLAEEKGMFDGCDPEQHANHEFWQQIGLSSTLLNRMRKFGIRNSALFSVQPTGNTSIFANVVSGGLEPVFLHEYIRTVIVNSIPDHIKDLCPKYWQGEFKETEMFKLVKEGTDDVLRGVDCNNVVYKIDRNRGLTKEVLCEDYGVRHLKKNNLWDEKADWAATTTNLSVEEHVRDMQGFGKWIDSSMSKTVNLPNDYPYDKFENLYLDAYKTGYLKGITTYRAGTMTSVLSSVKKDEVKSSEERPKEVDCDIYHIKVTRKLDKVRTFDYLVLVGKINENPYEVFVMENGFVDKKYKVGQIVKIKKGEYSLTSDNEVIIDDITKNTSEEEDSLTRMISCSLRNHVPIKSIVEQLLKVEGDAWSYSKAIARALKKYIKDHDIEEECISCGQKTVAYVEGCKICKSCGEGKC